MLRISPQSFAALETESERQFVGKLGAVVRDAVPSLATEPDDRYFAQIRLLIDQARGFGLTREQSIGAYAVTAGLLGVDFTDRLPGARQILESRESEDRKAELLEAFTMAIFDALER